MERATMAIKKLLIGQREWRYALVTQLDGSIAIVVTKPDGSSQALTVADVHHKGETGSLQFTCTGRRFSMHITPTDEENKQSIVSYADGKAIPVKSLSHKQLESLFMPATTPSLETSEKISFDQKIVKSPLAGRVTKVLITLGQQVLRGQPLLMIESMKMENELCAPASGSIKTISIEIGDVVKPNQVLLSLE